MRLAGGERERERGSGRGEREGGRRGGRGSRQGASVSKSALSGPRRDSGRHGGVGPGAGLAAGYGRGRWALAHRDSRTPQLARPGRTQAEAKINVRRADRGRPVGGPNTHPHLATQRASVHAGPGARVGPTAGPPWPPHLMGSLEEASLLPDTSLAAMVGTSQGAKRPREARERGPCGETHIESHRDKPGTHNAMGAIPIGARIDTGMSTQQAATHGKAHGYNACHNDQTPRGFADLFSDIPQRHRDTKTASGIPTHTVTHTTNPTVTRIHRDGAWNGPQRHQAAPR